MTSQQAVVDDAVSALLAVEYKAFATLAFLVYDWLISLDEEIRWFWDFRKGRRLTAAALLYGITRYCAIIGQVLVVLTVFRMSETACQVNGRLQTVTTISYVLAPPIFSTIRVYALSPNNKAIAILTFLLLCVPPFTTSVVNATDKATIQPSPFNCSSSPSLLALQLSHGLNVAGRICAVVGDLLVLFVTWYNTYTSYRGQRGVLEGPSITRVMLYNGSTCFIVLTGLNILSMIIIQAPSTANQDLVNNTIPSVTAVLTCRFLFDLRQADRTATTPSSPSAVSSLNFNLATDSQRSRGTLPPFIASMGSQVPTGLHFGDSIDGDEDVAVERGESGGETLRQGGEDEIGVADTPVERQEPDV